MRTPWHEDVAARDVIVPDNAANLRAKLVGIFCCIFRGQVHEVLVDYAPPRAVNVVLLANSLQRFETNASTFPPAPFGGVTTMSAFLKVHNVHAAFGGGAKAWKLPEA